MAAKSVSLISHRPKPWERDFRQAQNTHTMVAQGPGKLRLTTWTQGGGGNRFCSPPEGVNEKENGDAHWREL